MKLSWKIATLTAAGALLAGVGWGQFGGPNRGPGGRGLFGPGSESVSLYLDLSDQQRQDLKGIFEAAMKEARPLFEQLRSGHQALQDAVKANKDETELKQLVDAQAAVTAKLGLIRAKGMAKAYTLLSPEQRQKLEKLESRIKQSFRDRFQRFQQWRRGGGHSPAEQL
jgi:Spy/CpxP family protein refolding chaperone